MIYQARQKIVFYTMLGLLLLSLLVGMMAFSTQVTVEASNRTHIAAENPPGICCPFPGRS